MKKSLVFLCIAALIFLSDWIAFSFGYIFYYSYNFSFLESLSLFLVVISLYVGLGEKNSRPNSGKRMSKSLSLIILAGVIFVGYWIVSPAIKFGYGSVNLFVPDLSIFLASVSVYLKITEQTRVA